MNRFLSRVWDLADKVKDDDEPAPDMERLIHQTIKKVGDRVEALKFNTAISALMELAKAFGQCPSVRKRDFERFLLLLAPFAPHIAEELWERLGNAQSLARHPWPEYNEAAAAEDEIEIAVQVNGKVRGKITIVIGTPEPEIQAAAMNAVAQAVQGKAVHKVMVVGGAEKPRLVSVVVK
jgi:leucyl-tRNA synthetase